MGEDDDIWHQLLDSMHQGCVVPILGQDLFILKRGMKQDSLYALLAERLARELNLPVDKHADRSLNRLAARYSVYRSPDRQIIYITLYKLYDTLLCSGELPVPEPLLKLASIDSFTLFVTTTIDTLLGLAVQRVRGAARMIAYNSTRLYAPKPLHDPTARIVPEPSVADVSFLRDPRRPIVCHLLGQLCGVPWTFAVTDEDVVEFVHSLETNGPTALLDELHNNHLLIIGNGFPDGLARFFIRLGHRLRLADSHQMTTFIADRRVLSERSLHHFLYHFGAQVRIINVDPVDFVEELDARWRAYQARRPAASASRDVFLSFCHEDEPLVRRLAADLQEGGVSVWMDTRVLSPGDLHWAKISNGIETSTLFVPVITKTWLSDHAYILKECKLARKIATTDQTKRFIVPLVMGEISEDNRRTIFKRYDIEEYFWMKDLDSETTVMRIKSCRDRP